MTKLKPQFEITVARVRDYPRVYMLVGAGGTGARLAALLPKLVSPNDKIIIVDGDRVETKNLSRQHFLASDVGHLKADIVARRVKAALPPGIGDSVEITSIPERFEYPRSAAMSHLAGAVPSAWPLVMLGCVDNHEARNMMRTYSNRRGGSGAIWIDCGNDMRWGQVVMSFSNVRVRLSDSFLRSTRAGQQFLHSFSEWVLINNGPTTLFTFDAIAKYAPTLLEPPPPDLTAADCGVRLDTQTVAANNMAATAAGAMLAQVIDELPISVPCVEFSTAPPIMNARPFPTASAFNYMKRREWFIEPKPKEEKKNGQANAPEAAQPVR